MVVVVKTQVGAIQRCSLYTGMTVLKKKGLVVVYFIRHALFYAVGAISGGELQTLFFTFFSLGFSWQ